MDVRRTAMVSSTVRDLAEHRDAVLQACLEVGVFPRMMEHLPASDAEAVCVSTEMVDQSELYIGVFAHRYGYVPPGATRSVTEMEYERAVQRCIPRLIFLMSDDYRGLRASDVETGAGAERLKALKSRLQTERVVRYFTSPEDLRANVVEALVKYMATAERTPSGSPAGSSDLNVSSLDSPRRLTPLDGHPVLAPPGGPPRLFTGGVHVSFTLAHNGEGKHSINLHAMELEAVRFTSGLRPEYAYELEGTSLIGAGIARPHVFTVMVFGNRVMPARWVIDSKLGTFREAKSANFFDTDDPRILTFPADGADIEEIKGTVMACEQGLYELRFVFHYSVAGVDRQRASEVAHVYSDE
ncbi:MAG TPA: DUF4062 domain-containing protein [Archangium sp.]|uniref:DUF4062 domain-containing protein n=1 Tax=Archangium sp. TaxID=1872627 RepID=UPI002E2F8007|nr:DUF4062 domain-containing protein [Archangium sp.]HEX5748850.1 DUF4062 domain-containing protein [Archangium sp.]